MKIVKDNLVPILLTIAVTTGLFFILSYISYDIYSYKPAQIKFDNSIQGRIESDEFIANIDTETLDEFYQAPAYTNTQPELPLNLFTIDDDKIYNWLELQKPTDK